MAGLEIAGRFLATRGMETPRSGRGCGAKPVPRGHLSPSGEISISGNIRRATSFRGGFIEFGAVRGKTMVRTVRETV